MLPSICMKPTEIINEALSPYLQLIPDPEIVTGCWNHLEWRVVFCGRFIEPARASVIRWCRRREAENRILPRAS